MPEYLAIKRLSASDLTFFHYHHLRSDVGNQKCINLNADVFIDGIFPSLPTILSTRAADRLPITLCVLGPGFGKEFPMIKQIIKGATYKNWRLNGAFIPDPEDEPERFARLQAGDFAVFNFIGTLEPRTIRMCLVARANPDEADLHSRLEELLPSATRRTMASITHAQLNVIAESAACPPEHPLRLLAFTEELEDVMLGLPPTPAFRRTVSQAQIEQARRQQAQIGRYGEELINDLLNRWCLEGLIVSFRWESQRNAGAPYDFALVERISDGTQFEVLIDVKSTSLQADRPFHVSAAELSSMAAAADYRIFRVHEVADGRGIVRIIGGLPAFAARLLAILRAAGLPAGAQPTGWIIEPAASGLPVLGPDLPHELRSDEPGEA